MVCELVQLMACAGPSLQKLLDDYHCVEAFWLGNLKNRDIRVRNQLSNFTLVFGLLMK